MGSIIKLILGIVFIGMIVLLCLFSYIISKISDDYWRDVREELDKEDERH